MNETIHWNQFKMGLYKKKIIKKLKIKTTRPVEPNFGHVRAKKTPKTLAEILDKMAGALAHFVHNGVQII